jgi:type II secretory ATPase GspE/PulE/Tfp pilus assembly ATPase PilB-like protein
MLDLGMPAYLINSTLLGVMAQRLVRTLCPHCKQPGEPPDDETWRAITSPWRAEKPAQVMAPVGCVECRMTGYRGRIGLYEVMLMTPAIRKLVTAEADDAGIREQAYKDGMKPLRVSGDEGRRRIDHRRRGGEGRAAGLAGLLRRANSLSAVPAPTGAAAQIDVSLPLLR